MLHREPIIELCGADPHKFAELRGLDLINEQIEWKQRFFVPTDEEKGLAVLHRLLSRYPTLPTEESCEPEITDLECPDLSLPRTVNLDEWYVPVTETTAVSPLAPRDISNPERESALSLLHVGEPITPTPRVTESQLALNFG
jgi:hypothetical protein